MTMNPTIIYSHNAPIKKKRERKCTIFYHMCKKGKVQLNKSLNLGKITYKIKGKLSSFAGFKNYIVGKYLARNLL